MAMINKVILIGNIGRDVELRTVPATNQQVASVSVATSEHYTDRNTNERKELTEWHRVVFWGKQAETAGRYLRKGVKVYIEGKLKTRKYNDKEGKERYVTEIQADTFRLLDAKKTENENNTNVSNSIENMNNDIPF